MLEQSHSIPLHSNHSSILNCANPSNLMKRMPLSSRTPSTWLRATPTPWPKCNKRQVNSIKRKQQSCHHLRKTRWVSRKKMSMMTIYWQRQPMHMRMAFWVLSWILIGNRRRRSSLQTRKNSKKLSDHLKETIIHAKKAFQISVTNQ